MSGTDLPSLYLFTCTLKSGNALVLQYVVLYKIVNELLKVATTQNVTMKFFTGLALNSILSIVGPIQEINIIFINLLLTFWGIFVGISEKNTNNMFS